MCVQNFHHLTGHYLDVAVPPARFLRPVTQYALRPLGEAPEGGAA